MDGGVKYFRIQKLSEHLSSMKLDDYSLGLHQEHLDK